MKRYPIAMLVCLALPASADTSLMDGKMKTQRTVVLQAETQCSPDEAYAVFPDSVRRRPEGRVLPER